MQAEIGVFRCLQRDGRESLQLGRGVDEGGELHRLLAAGRYIAERFSRDIAERHMADI